MRTNCGLLITLKRIGFIGFDGVVSVDLSGPAEAFSCVRIDQNGANRVPGYEILTISASDQPFRADCGLIFKPHTTFGNAPSLDTIIIPGGIALRDPSVNRPISEFVRQRASQTRRIVSICTGAYGLAATGLLRGRRVTTHWRFARDLAARFPDLQVDANTLFIKDGAFYTSAGATAGIDLALFLIEEDYGPRIALSVARDLVVYLKRSGGQEQYSEPLQFQTDTISRLSELTTWILSHLNQDLSVETLAAKACLCPRQFGRRFKAEVGTTPGEFVERARLDEARRRLSTTDATIESIAASVGFNSSDVFRRRFEQRLGITPIEFRRRFNNINNTAVRKNQLVAA
ncbi:MAG TPA: GlxA family transcriptional regulator [Chthoniobacterales bacterium]|jgi:transcriptional regulator GlxA family with amidase domain